jgi:hypothetical protein
VATKPAELMLFYTGADTLMIDHRERLCAAAELPRPSWAL